MNLREKDACPRSHERGAVPTVLNRVNCRVIARMQRDRRQRKGAELHHSRHASVLKCDSCHEPNANRRNTWDKWSLLGRCSPLGSG
jgi:hypothetical protein